MHSLLPVRRRLVGSKALLFSSLSLQSQRTIYQLLPSQRTVSQDLSVTAGNNFAKELKFRELTEESRRDHKVKVLRTGDMLLLPAEEIVVGDVIDLSTGDGIPADGLYIEGRCWFLFFPDDSLVVGLNMECDESAMTGESMPRTKDKLNPFMLSGCTVSDGAGRMIVTFVGRNSEWGRTIAKLAIDPEITPMQRALGDMTELISWLGTAADETRGFLPD